MDFTEEGRGLRLFVCAVVEEAKGWLDEDEEGDGDAEALVSGVEVGVFLLLDRDVDP